MGRVSTGMTDEDKVNTQLLERLHFRIVWSRSGSRLGFTQRLVDGRPAPFSGETVLMTCARTVWPLLEIR